MNVRAAVTSDRSAVLALARRFVTSFELDDAAFRGSFDALSRDPAACFLVSEVGERVVGYLLGFEHLTLYANGRVGWVEEVMVSEDFRSVGIGRALMARFEAWAAARGCCLVALATRRAADFYRALGYEESATYFRKLLAGRPEA
jgi:GNAT superfamily N-acetyltransferase